MGENISPHQQVERYLEKNKFDKAIDLATKLLIDTPDDYTILRLRGSAYVNKDEYNLAIADLTRAIQLYSGYGEAYYFRGLCNYSLKEYEIAIIDIQEAKQLSCREDDCVSIHASCLIKLNQSEKAIEILTEYTDNYSEALKLRSELYWEHGMKDEANADILHVLQLELQDRELIQKFQTNNQICRCKEEFSSEPIIDATELLWHSNFRLYDKKTACCVYVLQFENGEYYVGQTKNLKTRLKQHAERFKDIITIYFKPIDEEQLIDSENQTIALFETHQIRIRNIKQIDFSNVFDAEKQQTWVENSMFNYLSGQKFDNVLIRSAFSERFLILNEKPYFNRIVQLMAQYFHFCIPNYRASEYNYWNITCLPKYLAKDNCLLRININAVPILSAYYDEDTELIHFMLFVSKLPFLTYAENGYSLFNFFKSFSNISIRLNNRFNAKTNDDELEIYCNENDFTQLLDSELYRNSIRLFNLRMLNNAGKGENPKRRTSHCLDLSDCIMAKIAEVFNL